MQVTKTNTTTSHVLANEHLIDERLASKKTTDQETQTLTAIQQKSIQRFLEANCDCV